MERIQKELTGEFRVIMVEGGVVGVIGEFLVVVAVVMLSSWKWEALETRLSDSRRSRTARDARPREDETCLEAVRTCHCC